MVGEFYNAEYVVDSLMADLRRISIANGFRTDIANVEMPNWSFEDSAKITAIQDEVILVWVNDDQGGHENANSSEDRPYLFFTVVGVSRSSQELQMKLLRMCQDIRRVMRGNPQRNHPDNTTQVNTWGVDTDLSSGFDLDYYKASEMVTIGVTFSIWRVSYRCSRATG